MLEHKVRVLLHLSFVNPILKPFNFENSLFLATTDIPIQTTLLFNSRRVAVARKILAVGERKFVLCRLFPSTVNGFNR